MDTPAILIKLTGLVLLGWTVFSIIKHVRQKRAAQKADKTQPVVEKTLNGILLYLWFAFMLAFSTGMMLNN